MGITDNTMTKNMTEISSVKVQRICLRILSGSYSVDVDSRAKEARDGRQGAGTVSVLTGTDKMMIILYEINRLLII
jgi:hypothetical protein